MNRITVFSRPQVWQLITVTCFFMTSALSADGDDWTRFRGANGAGKSKTPAPVKWSPAENVKWNVSLPGAGVSSPVVVGDKVILTCYSGYGVGKTDEKIEDLKRHVVCVNRDDGKILWDQAIAAEMPEDVYQGMGVPQHGYASHTPVTDGKNVYAFLGKSGIYAFDLAGKELWHQSVGTDSDDRNWGSASSPVLFEDLVIVPAICESMSLIAFNKDTGEQVWKETADGLRSCWGTPLIVKVDDQRSDLVLGVAGEIWGLNPKTGKMRWLTNGVPGSSFYTSVMVEDGIIYGSAAGRSGGGSIAVKVGGKGDVSESHVKWNSRFGAGYASPVVANDAMFLISRGKISTLNTKTGSEIKAERLPEAASSSGGRQSRGGMSSDYSSPVVADDKLYYVRKSGETLVFSAEGEFTHLGSNRVTDDEEEFSSTPAITDGQIFLRSNKKLYCIDSNDQ